MTRVRHWRPGSMLAMTAALSMGAVSGLAGCSSNSISEQAQEGSNKGYIAADGRTEMIAAADRGEPVALTGSTLDGTPFASTDARTKLLVVNVWASWCGPCDKEAPDLVAVATDPAVREVADFVGVNLREQPATGLAQSKAWGLPYPSVSDPGGLSMLALQGKAAAMPSTLVLDRQGRIAARVLGPVTSSTLIGMIEDVATQGTPS